MKNEDILDAHAEVLLDDLENHTSSREEKIESIKWQLRYFASEASQRMDLDEITAWVEADKQKNDEAINKLSRMLIAAYEKDTGKTHERGSQAYQEWLTTNIFK